jgi:hypothetical protein
VASHRFSLAGAASFFLHAAGISLLAVLPSSRSGADTFDIAEPTDPHLVERRWNPVASDDASGGEPSRIVEVLEAPDAVRVMLTPIAEGSAAKGLAWWSPARGIWLAVTNLHKLPAGHAYLVWIVRRDGPPVRVGPIWVNTEGAGRLLALAGPGSASIDGPVEVVVTHEKSAPSSRLTSDWVLAGRGVPRNPQ